MCQQTLVEHHWHFSRTVRCWLTIKIPMMVVLMLAPECAYKSERWVLARCHFLNMWGAARKLNSVLHVSMLLPPYEHMYAPRAFKFQSAYGACTWLGSTELLPKSAAVLLEQLGGAAMAPVFNNHQGSGSASVLDQTAAAFVVSKEVSQVSCICFCEGLCVSDRSGRLLFMWESIHATFFFFLRAQ